MSPERFEEVQELFLAALEKPTGQRKTFLEDVCAGDERLMREVESLLDHDNDADGPLDHSFVGGHNVVGLLAEQRGALSLPAAGTLPDAVRGLQIGPHRVLRELGRGGMGSVYLAVRDDGQFRHRVAIKLLRGAVASEELVERFQRERQILASIDHPNIARLFDGGRTTTGLPYFVMEFVDGAPITEYCDFHRLSVSARVSLFREVCSAVQLAHQNLVVHRDLKPGNILVTKTGDVKLVDFGIAKLLENGPTAEHAGITRFEGQLMTPTYASPEQIRGARVSTSFDIYSLGVVLYEILTGRPPIVVEGCSLAELMEVVERVEPVRPSAIPRDGPEGVRFRRDLRGDLDTIVLMALRKQPERRYASVDQLSQDLQRYLEHRPVRARADTISYRLARFVRRNRLAVTASVTVLFLLLSATLYSARERVRAERQAARASAINDFLQHMLSSADPVSEVGRSGTVLDILEWASGRVETSFANDPEIEADIRATIGDTYAALGLYDKAQPHVERALLIRTQIHPSDHPDVAKSLFQMGRILYQRGDYDDAEEMLLRSLAMQEDLTAPDSSAYVGTLLALSFVLQDVGRLQDAEDHLRRAVFFARESIGPDHPQTANLMTELATVLRDRGAVDEAEALHREALALKKRLYGDSHPDVADSLDWLGQLLKDSGRHEEAIPILRTALKLNRELMGDEHPATARTLHFLGDALHHLGQSEEAIQHIEEALDVAMKVFGSRHRVTGLIRASYGECLMTNGDPQGAERELSEAHQVLLEVLGADHAHTQRAAAAAVRLAELNAEH